VNLQRKRGLKYRVVYVNGDGLGDGYVECGVLSIETIGNLELRLARVRIRADLDHGLLTDNQIT